MKFAVRLPLDGEVPNALVPVRIALCPCETVPVDERTYAIDECVSEAGTVQLAVPQMPEPSKSAPVDEGFEASLTNPVTLPVRAVGKFPETVATFDVVTAATWKYERFLAFPDVMSVTSVAPTRRYVGSAALAASALPSIRLRKAYPRTSDDAALNLSLLSLSFT